MCHSTTTRNNNKKMTTTEMRRRKKWKSRCKRLFSFSLQRRIRLKLGTFRAKTQLHDRAFGLPVATRTQNTEHKTLHAQCNFVHFASLFCWSCVKRSEVNPVYSQNVVYIFPTLFPISLWQEQRSGRKKIKTECFPLHGKTAQFDVGKSLL